VSPVSAVRANGVAQLTGYAATVRIRLAILITLAACAGSLGGCKDHDVERLTAVKRDVCACKDARCADQAMTEVPKTAIRSTRRTQAIARDIMECRARLEAADRPSTDPDAEGRDEPAPAGDGAGSAAAPAAPAPTPPEPAPPKPAPPKAAR
jgi:hypothetical protein